MSEENKTVELKEEELEKVSGGEIWEYGDEGSCNHRYSVGQEIYYRVGTLTFYKSTIISRYGGKTVRYGKDFYPYYKIQKTCNGEYVSDVSEGELTTCPNDIYGTIY